MNRVLDSLQGPRRSLDDLADVLERFIGDAADEHRCREALDALRRIRQQNPGHHLRIALRALDRDGSPCGLVRGVIASLRTWRHFSGA